jgi:hypothetical protein
MAAASSRRRARRRRRRTRGERRLIRDVRQPPWQPVSDVTVKACFTSPSEEGMRHFESLSGGSVLGTGFGDTFRVTQVHPSWLKPLKRSASKPISDVVRARFALPCDAPSRDGLDADDPLSTEKVSTLDARTARRPNPFGHRRSTAKGWSIYGAQRAQPVATGGEWDTTENRSNKPIGNRWQPTATVSERMVRRGSTVRVRQRASAKCLEVASYFA